MVRSNKTSSESPTLDGLEENLESETETFRGHTEAESFIGSTTSATIKRIRKGLARLTKRDKR